MALQISISNSIGSRDRVSGSSVDPDAQAFITAAAITDPTQQAAINTLVVDLKGYGVWSKMKALYPMVGGTAATHKWNLKDPRDLDAAFRLVFNGGWTHSVNGSLPNGTNAFADTKCNISTQISNTSHAFGIYSRTNSTSGTQVYGTSFPSFTTLLFQNNLSNGNFISGITPDNVINYTANPSTSLIMATRRSSTDFQAYRAGVSLGTNTNVSSFFPSLNFYLSARNDNGTANFYNAHQLAFAFLSDGLTNTESGNFYTAVQTFQTTLGRSIGTQTVSDADAQAFVTNAGIVDQVEANAVNNLVIGMKADGLWAKMKAVYPFVGGTATTNKYNLKNPLDTDAAFRLQFNGGWTFSSNGALPNGTNAYADTFLIPSISLSLTSGHLSVYTRTNVAGGYDIGSLSVPGNIENMLVSRFSNNLFYVKYGSTYLTTSNTDSRGHFINNRNSNTNTKGIKNGVVLINSAETAALSTAKLFLAANNDTSFLPNGFSSRQLAFASIGDGLTDTEATNFYNRVQTFNTALARQV